MMFNHEISNSSKSSSSTSSNSSRSFKRKSIKKLYIKEEDYDTYISLHWINLPKRFHQKIKREKKKSNSWSTFKSTLSPNYNRGFRNYSKKIKKYILIDDIGCDPPSSQTISGDSNTLATSIQHLPQITQLILQ